jgi:hypothetical protein
MKRQATVSTVTETEFGVVTRLPAGDTEAGHQTEPDPSPEENTLSEGRQLQPLTLVLTMLGLALLILIPSLLLMQRLQP